MNPFFIVGCPRSGTTVLQLALNRHSRILIPPETKRFYYFHRMPRWMRRRQLARLATDLDIDLPHSMSRRDVDTRDVCQLVFESFRRKTGRAQATHFGEKTPEHTARIDSIRAVFPEAPIIFLQRDGRDVAASLMRVPWIRCNHLSAAAVWLRYYRHYRQWHAAGDPHIHFVRYEDLVPNPRTVLADLLQHLGLELEPAVYEAYGDCVGAIPEREYAWKIDAAGPITILHVQKWRRQLSPAQVADLETLCGPALQNLGYVLTHPLREQTFAQRTRLTAAVLRTLALLPVECIAAETLAFLHAWSDHLRRPL